MLQAVTVTLYTHISLEMSTSCYTIKVTTIIIPSAQYQYLFSELFCVAATCFRQYIAIIGQHSDIKILNIQKYDDIYIQVRNELYDVALRKFNFKDCTDGQTDWSNHVVALQDTSENKEECYLTKEKPTRCPCYFYFTSQRLNMFPALICPSSGVCDYVVELPHWPFRS